jgi:HTH-type transcriptional repressor of NAD biosynthesis genes
MTAMPPTKGHLNLIRFGASLAREVYVVLCTQPGEPMVKERVAAVRNAVKNITYSRVIVLHLDRELPQDPTTTGFWNMWKHLLTDGVESKWFIEGVRTDDLIVSSEPYGKKIADITGSTFMPYDPNRELLPVKATPIRSDVYTYFDDIMPEFQHNLRYNVTVFGAESTGKTTLSKELAARLNGHWFFEWARPYLETVGPEITRDSMEAIWHGQTAIQEHSFDFFDKPYAFYDTDLYSTIGYWQQPHWAKDLGMNPVGLEMDAYRLKSDLYIITKSNIDFEEDPIRYGGDHRESPDEYWIDIAERFGLNYVVLESQSLDDRLNEAMDEVYYGSRDKWSAIAYDRGGY